VIIRTVDYASPDAGEQLVGSLHETGFAVLSNHPIAGTQLDSIYQGWVRFFTSDERHEYLFDPNNLDGTQQGYHPPEVSETAVGHSTRDIKEYFHAVPNGRVPAALKKAIFDYRESTFLLGQQIVDWIQRFTPGAITSKLSEPFADMLCSETSLLRILHYPPLTGSEDVDAERAAAHEDINLVTVLPVAEQPGLQVRDQHGNWIDVASRRGELVINSGDMLREATGGYYPSTTHRVVNPSGDMANVSRVSIPFFLTPRPEVVLSDRYTSGSYLEERLKLITR
jgi:isopenicillin N synthase-like dioxygenase